MVSTKTCLGVLYRNLFLVSILFQVIHAIDPITQVSTPNPLTISPFGNFTLPILPTFQTMPPLFGNFTIPTMAPVVSSNFTFPTFAPLNLSLLTLPTIAPLNLGNFTLPTLNLGNFTIPTMAPLNLGNFTLPTFGTFGTFAPLNLSNLPTLPPLPTMAPLGNFTFGPLPTFVQLANFTLPTIPTMASGVNGTTISPSTVTSRGNATLIVPLGSVTITNLVNMTASNVTLPGGITIPSMGNATTMAVTTATGVTTMRAGNVTMLGNMTMVTTMAPLAVVTMSTTRASSNATLPGGTTIMGNASTTSRASSNVTLPGGTMAVTTPTGATTMRAGNATILGNVTMVTTMVPTMTTTKPAGNVTGTIGGVTMTTIKPAVSTTTPAPTVCGTTKCVSGQVCVSPLNATQTCIKRLPNRRYCIDNPCATGMKCFDNVTSNAYTCYTKLDGSAGGCLGIQCSPGDICYQVMGQPAKCIHLYQAPRCYGPNEEFSACKSGCESTCSVPKPPCMNTTTCTSGCACIRGYARINGVCQLMSKCPPTTTGNVTCSGAEEYVACKPVCEKTCSGTPTKACQLLLSQNGTTTTMAPSKCTPGCTCRSAYKRDAKSAQCVHTRQCFYTTTCAVNEVWSKCHNCETVCGQTANPSCKTCWSGCGCLPGYARSTNGTCVVSDFCY